MDAWDDITGEHLDPKEVQQARMKEIGYIREKEVWTKIPRKEAVRRGLKIIQTRWIDVNKGDQDNMVYRSRLVAKEFNQSKDASLFAATPPLEALKLLISEAATDGHDKTIMINDIARAFFEAPIRREVCVEIPREDREQEDDGEDMVALLQKSLYGTRDAAANFQAEVRRWMCSIGFKVGKYNASTFHHEGRKLKTMIHGDDFVTVGRRQDNEWFKNKMQKRFEIKTTVIGGGEDEEREGRVLNRVVRRTEEGWQYEGDQRHAEVVAKTLKMEESNAVRTPGEDEKACCRRRKQRAWNRRWLQSSEVWRRG